MKDSKPAVKAAYPEVDLHSLRHVTDRKSPNYGREKLDPVPLQPPLGYKKTPSLASQIQEQIKLHRASLLDMEPETEDEADDFEVDEDYDPHSRWENDFEPSLKEMKARSKQIEDEIKRREEKEKEEMRQYKGEPSPEHPSRQYPSEETPPPPPAPRRGFLPR